MAATKRRKGEVGVFFIYDHSRLQREEDDLKDAILYFYPNYISIDEQCMVCGQMMGMAEFFLSTISKSPPKIFKLQNEKFCTKRVGIYSFVLEGRTEDADKTVINHLDYLYNTFVLYCGSIDYIKQQYGNSHRGFLAQLNAFWDILLPSAGYHDNHLYQVFQVLPSVELPKSGGDLFLQSSNILQSSQRRPGVLVGILMYKNRVLCTQMSPELTRKLILITPQLPCHDVKTDYEFPHGVRVLSAFLTNEEHNAVRPYYKHYNTHCKTSRFTWNSIDSQGRGQRALSVSPRRFQKLENIPEKEDPGIQKFTSNFIDNENLVSKSTKTTWDYQSQRSYGFESESVQPVQSDQSEFSKKPLSERVDNLENSVPIITVSGEEATISDYEEEEEKGNSTSKKKLTFGKNGYKSPPSKTVILNDDFMAIEDFEQEKSLKKNKPKSVTPTEKGTRKRESSFKEERNELPAKSGEEIQNDKNNGITVTADIHASFEESLGDKNKIDSVSSSEVTHSVMAQSVSDSEIETTEKKHTTADTKRQLIRESHIAEDITQGMVSSSSNTHSSDVNADKSESSVVVGSGISVPGATDVVVPDSDTLVPGTDKAVPSTLDTLVPCTSDRLLHDANSAVSATELNITRDRSNEQNDETEEIDSRSSGEKVSSPSNLSYEIVNSSDLNSSSENGQEGKTQSSSSENEQKFENGRALEQDSASDENLSENHVCDKDYSRSEKDIADNFESDKTEPTQDVKSSEENDIQSKADTRESPVQVDRLSVVDRDVSVSPSARGETTSPESSTSDPAEKKETLDFPASDSHGISADESASEMIYNFQSANKTNDSKSQVEQTNHNHCKKNQQSGHNSNNDLLPPELTNQIGDSIDSVESDKTLVSQQSWASDIEGLNEVTMYVQRHCDVSLLLLMENEALEDQNVVISLWKTALPHLADMDFYVKECTDFNIDEAYMSNQSYIQYDSFFQSIKGNVVQPLTGGDEEFHRLSCSMHETFIDYPGMTDVSHRSHSSCCYGHRTINNETYYHLNSNIVHASSLPSSKHPIFSMDSMAARKLPSQNISLL